MILSDTEILKAIEAGTIVIDPFDIANLGGNSYDVRLAPVLRVYETSAVSAAGFAWRSSDIGDELYRFGMDWANLEKLAFDPQGHLDCAVEPKTLDIKIPESGILLVPGILYLASTVEYTETHEHVPYLDGKSSIGRLGIFIHATAGRGDVDFRGPFTCEINVVQPVRVYAGQPIGQLTYHTVRGPVERKYTTKPGASYVDGRNPLPQPSRLWTKMRKP